jgi:hypothetical protein
MIGSASIPGRVELPSHNLDLVDRVMECVQEGTYCAILGPLLSGKTESLRHIQQLLSGSYGWVCVYINLYDARVSTLRAFFGDLMAQTARHIRLRTTRELPVPRDELISGAVFRAFLADAVSELGSDLVLVLDHLEAPPTDLVQALLTSLRAAYMDQLSLDHRLISIVSGALSLATLTVGESSPFRGIARRVFVGDLTPAESSALIEREIAQGGVAASDRARRMLLRASCGDPYLIKQLCQRCVSAALATRSQYLRASHVKRTTRLFLRDEVSRYGPLLEAVRLIEDDPDLLHCVLLLLRQGTMRRSQLPLPLSPDLDPLYLTGVVEKVGDDRYRVQNTIYRQFLAEHFHPGRVGHLLAMAGRWDAAIDYLEAGIRDGDQQALADLLPATINSMYASEDVGQAAHFLVRGLSGAFGVSEASVWTTLSRNGRLRLVGGFPIDSKDGPPLGQELDMDTDRLEARACRQVRALRGAEGEQFVRRAVPLVVAGEKPVGVVTLCDWLPNDGPAQQRERDLRLVGYLNQAARAMAVVATRRQELTQAGHLQAGLLPGAVPSLDGWQFAAAWRPARETSGDFYDFIPLPGDRIGIVIADVADKGIGAALYMALSRTLIRNFAADFPAHPDRTMEATSQRILDETEAGLFVTVFYGVLDPVTGALTYCNAGHHPPFLMSTWGDGRVHVLPGRGLALGVLENASWGRTTVEMQPGATLLMYTDGVVDTHNANQVRYGDDRLLVYARDHSHLRAQSLVDGLVADVQRYASGEPQFDDITVVAIRRER